MLPSACGLRQHFRGLGHSFSLCGPPSRQITYIYQHGSRGLPGNLIVGYQNIEGGGHGKETLLLSTLQNMEVWVT